MTLPPDFYEWVACCAARDVRFLVVGGHAVTVHGYPRATDDFDTWIQPGVENGGRVVAALRDFGFASLGLVASDFDVPGVVVQLGQPPLRIDILTGIEGVTWEECYPGRIVVEIQGLAVPFIGRDCLLVNKRAVGRAKDLADVEGIGQNPPPAP